MTPEPRPPVPLDDKDHPSRDTSGRTWTRTSTLLPGQQADPLSITSSPAQPPPRPSPQGVPPGLDPALTVGGVTPPRSAVADMSRLTVVETVYFQTPEGEPSHCPSRFARMVASDEQPYQRTSKVGEEWVDLDLGWLKGVGVSQVVIENLGGRSTGVIPTAAEKAEAAERVVEVGYRVAVVREPETMLHDRTVAESDLVAAVVRPGQSMRFEPGPVLPRIRCRRGTVRVAVSAFPA